jgi:type I restriction enzyme, S subunit
MKATLSAGWQLRKLGEIAKVIPGFAFKSKDWCKEGLPVIKIKNIVGDLSVDTDEVDCVPMDLFTDRLRKFVLGNGDILVAMTGATAGKVGRLRCKATHLLNQRVAKLAPNDVDPLFFWAVISSEEYQRRFFKLADGAAQPNMSGSQIENVELLVPSPANQHKIAGILSAYDDLIENNTRRIAILEAMAQAIYWEWFVKFRFPGHEKVKLVTLSLGKVPEGWKVTRLHDLTSTERQITYGVVKPGDTDEQGVQFIRGGDISNGAIAVESLRTISKELSATYKRTLLRGGELLVSLVGNPGEVAIAPMQLAGSNIARQVGMVVLPNRPLTLYVLHYLSSQLGRSELTANTTGSVQKVINLVHLKGVRVVLPPEDVLCGAAPIFDEMNQQIELLRNKTRNLRKTRDLLRPKLISGQLNVEDLDIDDGEPQVEAEA